MHLFNLNEDCLLKIFSYCNEKDLVNLCRSHTFLSDVIESNIFYGRSLDLLLCGHRNHPIIQERTQLPFYYSTRVRVARNWLLGCYTEQQYFPRSKMFATKLVLERDWLYLSYTGYICQHKRLKIEALQRRYHQEIATSNKTDIADFVKKGDSIFAGRVAGSCFIYENSYATEQQLHNTNEHIWCVDFADEIYATSSNQCAKLWRRSEEFGLIHLDLCHNINNSYKTLRFNESGNLLFGGLYTSTDRHALQEIDLESGVEKSLNSNSISIYDLKLKDDHTLYTAHFDTSFRLFDRRSDKDEMVWEDPFDSSFYCLDHDGLYAVVCGTKYHSRVNLYDIRQPGKFMQLYYPQFHRKKQIPGRFRSSPVYSIACDSRYLFVATDHHVHVLDFKVNYAVARDYSDCLRQYSRC